MSALDTEIATNHTKADLVATVRAQLAPIPNRRALLDSYRRESLYRLAPANQSTDAAADVLELAYAARWAELGDGPVDDFA